MKEKRYYYDNDLMINSTITLEGDEFHHFLDDYDAKLEEKKKE